MKTDFINLYLIDVYSSTIYQAIYRNFEIKNIT